MNQATANRAATPSQPVPRHIRFALLAACLLGAAAHADVRARIEPRIIDELDTARLILRVDGTQVETLDLEPLAADFEVLGTQTASQYQSVNGAVEAWVEYQITLRPTRAGDLTIPSITVGREHSAPLPLEVRGIDPELRTAIDRMVFFELEVTRNPVYVRGETVLIRRLYYSSATQIYSDLPGTPELSAALVLPIGETRSGTTERNGERYGVIEQRFAIYPERSGTLTVPSISLTSSVRIQVDGRLRRTGARVNSEPLAIEVLPIPSDYPAGVPWLPASAVTLTDTWVPNSDFYTVGQPVERKVEVRVVGNLAASISPPADVLPEQYFRQYPEPAGMTDDRAGPSIVGTRVTNYSIIPTTQGRVALPALGVTWWDVDQAITRTTQAAGRTLTIAPGATVNVSPVAEPAQTADAEPTEAPPEPSGPAAARSLDRDAVRAALTVAALGLAVLLIGGFGLRSAIRHRVAVSAGLARGLEAAGLVGERHGLARARRLRALRRQIEAAAGNADPATTLAALQAYLACWYRRTPAEAARQFRGAGFGSLLDQLLAARFRLSATTPPGTSMPAMAGELLTALSALQPPARRDVDPLPPLFERG